MLPPMNSGEPNRNVIEALDTLMFTLPSQQPTTEKTSKRCKVQLDPFTTSLSNAVPFTSSSSLSSSAVPFTSSSSSSSAVPFTSEQMMDYIDKTIFTLLQIRNQHKCIEMEQKENSANVKCVACRKLLQDGQIKTSPHHPSIKYCASCFEMMYFDYKKRWKGVSDPLDPNEKPLTWFCAICWTGCDDEYKKTPPVVCDTATCPHRECWTCIEFTRPELHAQLVKDVNGTPFKCMRCCGRDLSKSKKSTILKKRKRS